MIQFTVQLPDGWTEQPIAGHPHIHALTSPAGGVVSVDHTSGSFAAGVCVPGPGARCVSDYDGAASRARLVVAATMWLDQVMRRSTSTPDAV